MAGSGESDGGSADEQAGRSLLGSVLAAGRSVFPGVVRRNYLLKFGIALLLVVLLITVAGINTINETTATLDEQISEQLLTETEREAEDIQSWRDQHSRWLNGLSKTRVMQSERTLPISAALQQEGDTVPDDVLAVHFIDLESTLIRASNNGRREGATLRDEGVPWAQTELSFENSDDVVFTTLYEQAGIPVVAFVTPVPERDDAGLVAVVRQNQWFTRFSEARSNRFVTVVDENGTIVMDRRDETVVGTLYHEESATNPIQHRNYTGATFLDTAPNQAQLDREYVAAVAPVEDTNWTVVSHAAREEVYLVRSNIIRNLIELLLLSLVGLALTGIIFAGGTVRSINRLAGKVQAIEEGNLDVGLSTDRVDEIGQLYDGFESMRDSLRQQIGELSEAIRAEEQMQTELRQANRELEDQRVITSVLNRLLRHNLRNSLTTILLRTENLSDTVSGQELEEVESIKNVSQRLIRRADKSRAIEDVIQKDPASLALVDVTELVCESAAFFEEEYPQATVQTSTPDRLYARGGDGISFILDNLVENAIEHNDTPDPTVHIEAEQVTEDGTWVELSVADDGPGIPEMEIEVLESGEETPLAHSSGIGLWLINWLTDHLNGQIAFENREPRGSIVTVRLPRPDADELDASPRASGEFYNP